MSLWQGVSEFVAVADAQSFTRAADHLDISTAQVSRQVRMLEKRLGTDLLYRTTRRVHLTEAGQLYYQSCRPLLEALNDAGHAVQQLQSVPQGLIRLTAPVTWGERHLTVLLNDFLLQYPDIRLYCELTNEKLDLIADDYDLAIRLGRADTPQLIARRLSGRFLNTCASPEYLARWGTPRALSQLAGHNCLMGTLDYWRFRDDSGERMLRIQGRLRCNSGSALLDAALRGLGIIQLPDYYTREHLERGELIEILTDYAPDEEGVWALYPPGRQLSPKIRILLDFLTERL
ncbi:MAG TPA: LysR family transcriptional regulator [Oceanospirillales bacterium]|nr:LysR family transcriptional regulator [Oceanospirillaceae bacterium]HBS41881.1 LysR family transcriptional regulator [Oceanospirillales bacterium]|tara:strand:- start:32078 stop:32944 length:867 start_codon:yes stop_codon:yes gene_type:complete